MKQLFDAQSLPQDTNLWSNAMSDKGVFILRLRQSAKLL